MQARVIDSLFLGAISEMATEYAESILAREISFDRALKKMEFATGLDANSIEELLIEEVRFLCPLNTGAI